MAFSEPRMTNLYYVCNTEFDSIYGNDIQYYSSYWMKHELYNEETQSCFIV